MGPEGDVVDAILTSIPLCDFNGIRSMKLPYPIRRCRLKSGNYGIMLAGTKMEQMGIFI